MEVEKQRRAYIQQAPKILVVDDREDNLFSVETILQKDGYDIIKAPSGRAALRILLQQQDFSLILMDVYMPDMNGFETASLIYKRDSLKEIPIIFITAHNSDEKYIFEGYRMGAVDYIFKPINPDLLRSKVSVFVQLHRQKQVLLLQEKVLRQMNESLKREVEERKISEQKVRYLNDQLLQNNQELVEANKELDRFAYLASHDLQEPLRKIRLLSDNILTKQEVRGGSENTLKKIIGSAERMQQLIDDLLKFSRYSAGASDFVLTDLNLLVQEALQELEQSIQFSDIHINVGRLPVLYVIPTLMRQLFYNLLSNAIKFRKKEGPLHINITSRQLTTPPGGQLNGNAHERFYSITVSDNGIGFHPSYADDIFVLFKRLHSYHEYNGSGVGLAICKKISEQHHGSLKAYGHPDEGAEFTLTLPGEQVV
ncbi:response regulator [Foetidibacter luteolus]|uniref:response regulator n=1 Tax=Foetidibacter luteolus TaxID=2608880 RepID=UPI00129A9067|nr:response regulator [Foetidibacter luteolus]